MVGGDDSSFLVGCYGSGLLQVLFSATTVSLAVVVVVAQVVVVGFGC
ncbi:hypothetical protein A2U01_0009970 [Trifolium medium]|uniref:Transmembrane protein n=1 Tax=Trifolium medium TaxID=97028 RepID=A0A392MNL0_9FABA|nr:hypothetical protein [Trifolium medium]